MASMTIDTFFSRLPEIAEDIKSSAFDESPEPKQLFMVALALAFFWAIAFKIMMDGIYMLIRDEPAWIVQAADRDYDRSGKQLAEKFGMDASREGCRKQFLGMWPWMQAVLVQHFVGGFLCVPSLFNLMPDNPSMASSLACLGILSELGWEMQDSVYWIHKRYFTKNGKETVALPFMVVLCVHHSMTMCLGVPLILRYRNLKTLHWLCFDLQLGAAISLGVAEYTKLLDLSVPSHLRQFQFLTTFALISVVWTRLFHWIYLVVEFIMVWYREEAHAFLAVGGFLGTLFSVFSYLAVVEPYYKRWHKFCLRKREYEHVVESKTSTQQQRRSSFLALDEAAEDMILELERETAMEEVADWILKPRDVAINRRASLPASLKLGDSVRRRSSFLRFLQDPDSSMRDDSESDATPAARRATMSDDSMSSLLASHDLEKHKED